MAIETGEDEIKVSKNNSDVNLMKDRLNKLDQVTKSVKSVKPNN